MPDDTIRTPKPDSVRIGGPADEANLLNFFIDAHTDNPFAKMDVKRMAEWAGIFTRHPKGSPHSVIGIVDGPDGKIAGCAGLVLFQPWFSSDWAIEEQVISVRPECRSMKIANDLMLFCKWFAEKLGLTLYIGVRSKDKIETKSKLFHKHFSYCGGFFFYEGAAA
jgi:hypothetical protein